jgi:hypothetical protein
MVVLPKPLPVHTERERFMSWRAVREKANGWGHLNKLLQFITAAPISFSFPSFQ